MLGKILRFLTDNRYRCRILAAHGFYDSMPDEEFLKKIYKAYVGMELDLEHPKRFNEKLQWLKLYNRQPEYTMMVDKYKVRDYIAKKIGEEHLIPLLGVWNDPDEIDFEALPSQFVLKCNHNSGLGMCICKDKSKLNIDKVKKELRKGLKQNYYLRSREWPYKDVPRKIVAEKFMVDESGTELKDYKFFCFDGKPKFLFVATDRGVDTRFDFFDTNFEHLPFSQIYPNATKEIKKPQGFEEMLRLAEVLSEGMPHVRVDFYNINGKIYFGELTFFQQSGLCPFVPDKWDFTFGDMIKLPKCSNDNK